MPAARARGVPTPAHMNMRPRLPMVEYASTRLALLCVIASRDVARNDRPPTRAMTAEKAGSPWKDEVMRRTRKAPRFTMVDECSKADTGVGATMAPSSQDWNGSCADFVNAAIDIRARGISAMPVRPPTGMSIS